MPRPSAVLLLLLLAACAAAPRPPNVVLIVADDLGLAELGCYGQQRIRTPRLDRLAREGLRFTQFYAGSAVCAPSRAALLTGRHTGHAAIRDNHEVQPEGQSALPDAELTLAEALRARGYATAAIGKWGLGAPGSEGEPNRQGFGRWFGYLCQRAAHDHTPDRLWRDGEPVALDGRTYAQDLFLAEALDFVRASRDRPFLLYLAFEAPHLSLEVPGDSLAEYQGLWDDPPYDGSRGYDPHPAPRAAYAAMVTRLDRDVGRLVDELDALGLGEDTLVVFTSDNGPTYDRLGGSDSEFFASTGGLRGLKGRLFEGGLRVPAIARWTGRIAPGRVETLPAAAWDLLPTCVELAGGTPPAGLDGASLATRLLDPSAPQPPRALYWELASYGGQQALRWGDWKLLRTGLGTPEPRTWLFDLAADPAEAHDLLAQRPDVARELERRLDAEHAPTRDFPLPGE